MKNKLKILVAYHKRSALFSDDILEPIHLGRILAHKENKDGAINEDSFKWMCENMIGDDSGDNISHLNHYFNEFSGIYYAWKNYEKLGNPAFIGFMTYRCFFYMRDFKDGEAYFNFSDFSKYFWSRSDSKKLKEMVDSDKFDIILNMPVKLKESVKEQYQSRIALSEGHIASDIETMENIINSDFPHLSDEFRAYINGSESYFTNMFIMRKNVFFEFCEIVFPILFKYHQSIDYSNRNVFQQRMFISERVAGMAYGVLKRKYSWTHLPVSVVFNTSSLEEIKPAFKDSVAICASVDEFYLPYLFVMIDSLLKNANRDYKYEIYILHTSINVESQNKFLSYFKDLNVCVKFINVATLIGEQKFNNISFYTSNHIKEATYYRFFIPNLFKDFEKILYLDADMLVLSDISTLFFTDLGDNYLAAAKDYGIEYNLKSGNEHFKNYQLKTLEMKNPHNYFQAGCILYDIKKCLEIGFTDICLNALAKIKKPLLHDQDVLNSAFEGKVLNLELNWNYTWNIPIVFPNYSKYLSTSDIAKINEAKNNPYIIHYCDHIKPWNLPHLPKASLWWEYARKTPYYEEILFNQIKSVESQKKCGAIARVKNQLSYKIGAKILQAKSALNAIKLPFAILYLIAQHKIDLARYNSSLRINPTLKQPRLESYADYAEALKAKNHLSYRLGNALLKNPLTFLFKALKIYKDFKRSQKC